MINYDELIEEMLKHPDKLKVKKPFTRGVQGKADFPAYMGNSVEIGEKIDVNAPNIRKVLVTQEQFVKELDPNSHDVLFDENIPAICVKVKTGGYKEVAYKKMALPIQRILVNKQTMHLAANPLQFTLMDKDPLERQRENFIVFKQYWKSRNQEGLKYKMVATQKSYGDAGWLFYYDRHGKVKSKILSFADGYVLCSHNDPFGDRLMECVYYVNDNVEHLDCYTDLYLIRFTRSSEHTSEEYDGWTMHAPLLHGFEEIPLITKRGDVAWNNVQTSIECYEELYNVFNAIQKRWGWGIFYVKGKFKDEGKRIGGNIVLNDTSMDGNGDAKFLTPPTPQGTIDTLNLMMESIQLGSSTTFILPKDIKMSGDVSGIAVQLTQSQDNELALQSVIDWQNVADKAIRLFKYGLAKELVQEGVNPYAVTEFESLDIHGEFKIWKPLNEYEFNQMLTILTGAGILSKESGIELNTLSKPDEKSRVDKEEEIRLQREERLQQQKQVTQQSVDTDDNKDNKEGEE